MNMKKLNYFIYFILIEIFLIGSCTKSVDQDALVQETIQAELQKKINYYKNIRNERCLAELYRQAGEIADSILLVEARMKRDSIQKPKILPKPEKPEMKKLVDSLEVKPFLKGTPYTDTLENIGKK